MRGQLKNKTNRSTDAVDVIFQFMYLQLLPKVQFPLRKNEQTDEDCGPVGTVEAGSCEKGHSGPLRQLPERKNLRIVTGKDETHKKKLILNF